MGERLRAVLPSVLPVVVAMLVGWVGLVLLRGAEVASQAYLYMLQGGLGDWGRYLEGGSAALVLRPLGESAIKASLLVLTGLSVAVAFQVGLFNIGAQGQMLLGAVAAAVVGAQVALPGVLHVTLAVAVAALVGALWASVATALKLYRGVHEVISTIMLNWVAISLVDNWLVVGPLRARGTHSVSGTDEILASAQLTRLLGDDSRLNTGFLLALVAALGVWVWLGRMRAGFEVRAVGLGPEAARTAGIAVGRRTAEAMALSGALAGVAGAVLVLGTEWRYPGTLGAPYGFDGIGIALIGQGHPLGVTLSALFFGVLRAGGTRMQLLTIHRSFPELLQGLALLLVAGRLVWVELLRRRRQPAPVASSPAQPQAEVPRA